MRDKIAYWLMDKVLTYLATKEYQALVNVATGLGMYTLEHDLEGLDELTDQAEYGRYLYENWDAYASEELYEHGNKK